VIIFKNKLYAKIETKFLENWANNDLDTAVMHLECSKALNKDDEKKWRPTGQSVNDQMRPIAAREQAKRKQLLQRQLDYQNNMIESLIPVVEQYRQQFKEEIEERQQIKVQSEQDTVKLLKTEEQIDVIAQMF
jgi:hypothetical protein